jgi:carbonic anhydrase
MLKPPGAGSMKGTGRSLLCWPTWPKAAARRGGLSRSILTTLARSGLLPRQRDSARSPWCSAARTRACRSNWCSTKGPNDLFVIRVAGNSLGEDVLGSLRYAIDHLRETLRLIVVLGHSGRGALSAAVDSFLNPAGYLPLATNYSLRSIVDRQFIVVQAAARKLASLFGNQIVAHARYREALIEAAIVSNAALTAHTVQRELRALGLNDDLRALFGVYLLQAREIWAPHPGGDSTGLAEPPDNVADFAAFADRVARSERIAAVLTAP